MSNQTILITNYRINNPSQSLFDIFARCGKIVSFQLNEGKEKADAVITYDNPFSAEIALLLDSAALGPQGEKIRVRSKGKTWNPESSGFQDVDISNREYEQPLIPSSIISNLQSLGHQLKENVEESAKQLDSRIEMSEFKDSFQKSQGAYSIIKNTFQALGNVSRDTYASATDVAKRAGEIVMDAGVATKQAGIELVRSKSQETIDLAKYMYENMKTTGQEATQAATDAVTNILSTGKDTLVDATHMATDTLSGALHTTTDTISGALHTTTDTVSELVHTAADTGKAALSSATGVVMNTGIGEVIKNTGNAVVSGGIAALEATGNVLNYAGEVVASTGEKIASFSGPAQSNEVPIDATKSSM